MLFAGDINPRESRIKTVIKCARHDATRQIAEIINFTQQPHATADNTPIFVLAVYHVTCHVLIINTATLPTVTWL